MATKAADTVTADASLDSLAAELVASLTAQADERRALIEDLTASVAKGRLQLEALGLR